MFGRETGMPEPIIIFLIIIGLSYVIPVVTKLFSILRLTIFPQQLRELESIPALSPIQQAAVSELDAIGFKPVIAYISTEDTEQRSGLLLRHATLPAFAILDFRARANNGFPIVFYSFADNNVVLATANRCPAILEFPKVQWFDPYADTISLHWQAHLDRLKNIEALTLEDGEVFARIAALNEEYFSYHCNKGSFTCSKTGNWFPTLRTALHMILTTTQPRGNVRKRYQTILTSDEYQSAYYAECYREQEMLRQRRKSRPMVTLSLLILSLLVSLVIWSWGNSWFFAAVLIIVLLVHECGHALAMYIFGYRDMSMFFVPMVGAMVTGNAKNIPVWKQAIILFAGPVPGMLFGLWAINQAYMFSSSHLILRTGLIAFGLNLFNLLPIMPLDGGQLIAISLLVRWPYAMLAFAGLSFAAVLGLALWLKSTPMYIIVFFIGIYMRNQWRITQLRREWKGQAEQDDQLEGLFKITRQKIGNLPFMRQYLLVRNVFNPPTVRKPRLWETGLVLSLMVVMWVSAVYAFYYYQTHCYVR